MVNGQQSTVNRIAFFILAILCCIHTTVWGQDTISAQEWQDRVIPELDEMVKEAEDSHYFTAICVYDLTFDQLVYGYNQHKKMRPASTQKLVTSISALDQLGPDYPFRTQVWYTGSLDSLNVLNGDLYIIGGMDPMFNSDGVKALADSIKAYGIQAINGRIYADISMKDDVMLGSGWCWDDDNPQLIPLNVDLSTLSRVFRENSIKWEVGSGKQEIIYKTYPGNGTYVCSYSHTLRQVLQRVLKQSDNTYAESVFYQLGARRKKNCSTDDCIAQIRTTLIKTDQPLSAIEIADGSGLSLYNYITPRMEVALLKYASHVPQIFNTLYPTLPIAGVDGTLSSRAKGTTAYRNVHAKTGTVSHVITLAGYFTGATGHLYAFSLMSNGTESKSEAREFHDRILGVLTKSTVNSQQSTVNRE